MLLSYCSNTFPEGLFFIKKIMSQLVNFWYKIVFDNYNANVMFNNKNVSIGLWDTAGPEGIYFNFLL